MNMLNSNQLVVTSYDGTTDPAEFARLYSMQAVIFKWNNDEKKENLSLYLTGKAKRLYDSTLKSMKTVGDMLTGLQEAFARPQDKLVKEFYTTTRLKQESISTFADRIHELLLKALPGLENKAKDALLRTKLSENLPAQLRQIVDQHSNMSWDDLLERLEDKDKAESIAKHESIGGKDDVSTLKSRPLKYAQIHALPSNQLERASVLYQQGAIQEGHQKGSRAPVTIMVKNLRLTACKPVTPVSYRG